MLLFFIQKVIKYWGKVNLLSFNRCTRFTNIYWMDAVFTLCCLHTSIKTKPSKCFLLEREWNEMTSMMPVSLLVVYRYIDGSHVKFFYQNWYFIEIVLDACADFLLVQKTQVNKMYRYKDKWSLFYARSSKYSHALPIIYAPICV